MVDIDFVRGRPALKVEFRASLAADLFNALGLVVSAPSMEGFDQWVYATHTALPPELKEDIEQVLILIQKCGVMIQMINELSPGDPAHRDFGAFVEWINSFSQHDMQQLIEGALAALAGVCCEDEAVSPPSLDETEELKAVLGVKIGPEKLDRTIQLLRNPGELKAQFISVATRFWEQFYRQEFQRCLPLMDRSVGHHRRRNYGADFSTIFSAVSGRRVPEDYEGWEDAEQVVFIPSCHIGPYVIFNLVKEPSVTLTVVFNCRPTGVPEGERASGVQDLFPPLKALADETRLQILSILDGRELYAQEIVAHLDISQSAVSRHLKLMVTGGLLTVRKRDSMKYFSINEQVLDVVADRLGRFRGKRE